MKNIFKPEQFEVHPFNEWTPAAIAHKSNMILNEMIEKSPVVYGHKEDSRVWKTERIPRGSNNLIEMYPEAYSARLMFVEEINPKLKTDI